MRMVLFVLVAFASSLLQGTMGIGFAIIYVTLGSFLFPYLEILVSERLLAMLFMVPVIARFRDKIRWRYIWLPLLFSVLGTRIALLVMRVFDERQLIIILGAVHRWHSDRNYRRDMRDGGTCSCHVLSRNKGAIRGQGLLFCNNRDLV